MLSRASSRCTAVGRINYSTVTAKGGNNKKKAGGAPLFNSAHYSKFILLAAYHRRTLLKGGKQHACPFLVQDFILLKQAGFP